MCAGGGCSHHDGCGAVAQSMHAQSAVSTMRALATLGWQAASGGAVVLNVVVCAPVSKPCDHQPAATRATVTERGRLKMRLV